MVTYNYTQVDITNDPILRKVNDRETSTRDRTVDAIDSVGPSRQGIGGYYDEYFRRRFIVMSRAPILVRR